MNRAATRLTLLLVLTLTSLARGVLAQTDPTLSVGIVPYGSYHSGDIDSIDLTTGNVYLDIPLISYPQRGGKLTLDFRTVYNAKGWTTKTTCTPRCRTQSAFVGGGAYLADTQGLQTQLTKWYQTGGPYNYAYSYNISDYTGSSHQFLATNLGVTTASGSTILYYASGETTDGSNIALISNFTNSRIILPNGVAQTGAAFGQSWGVLREDSNGNQILGNTTGWMDTVGRYIPGSPGPGEPRIGLGQSSTNSSGCTGPLPITSVYVANMPGPTGASGSVYKFCYVTLTLETNFHTPLNTNTQGGGIYSGFLQSIVLPNGTAWTFQYNDRDPGDSASINYGDLTQITFPTGGTITYTWESVGLERWVASRTTNSNDGTGPHSWNYTWGPAFGSSSTVTAPPDSNGVRNDTVHSFSAFGSSTILGSGAGPAYETEIQHYAGSASSNNILLTETNSYQSISIPVGIPINPNAQWVTCVQPVQSQAIWPNGQIKEVDTAYDGFTIQWENFQNASGSSTSFACTHGNSTQISQYDYGVGSRGPLLRQEVKSYLSQSNANYTSSNLIALLASDTVYDGNGNLTAQSNYGYDEYSLTPSGIVTQLDSVPPDGTFRGNRTSIHRLASANVTSTVGCPGTVGSGSVTSYKIYFDTGTTNKATDSCGSSAGDSSHSTVFAYSSAYVGAYATTISNPLNQSLNMTYDLNSGLLTSLTDANGQSSSKIYDNMWRIVKDTYPGNAQSTYCYTDAGGATCALSGPPYSVVESDAITTTQNKVSTSVYDGLGRLSQEQINSDPDGTDYRNHVYDALGRVYSVSNPFRTTSDPTYGITSYQYDALDRTVQVAKQDGGLVKYSYSGNCSTVTDEAGNNLQNCNDGIDRLTSTIENPGGLGYVTNYTYDAIGNLTCGEQHGNVSSTGCSASPSNDATSVWRVRRYNYDSLSRLVQSHTPEAGTIVYTYNADGSILTKTSPAPNQTNPAVTVTLSYCYDALQRPSSKAYSNQSCPMSAPVASYYYDQPSANGLTITNGVGRRTSMTDSAGSEAWSFDPRGRVVADKRTTNGISKTTVLQLNLLGAPISITYPSGSTISYTYNAASRAGSASDTANGITYAWNAHYAAHGGLASLQNGAALLSTLYYNPRLQPCRFSVKNAGAPPSSCSDATNMGNVEDYTYGFNSGIADNGNILSVTNNITVGRSQVYSYDLLNRLSSAKTQATSGSYAWGLSYSYDPWANLLSANTTQGTAPSLCVVAAPTNQFSSTCTGLTSFSYDAAGNMLNDGTNSYSYDAENHVLTAAGLTYSYDGDGKRIMKSSGKIYWFGAGSGALDETDAGGNLTDEYVFFGGSRIARRDSSSNVVYYFADHVGTARVVTNSAGVIQDDSDFYPFGGENVILSSSGNSYKFTGKERDAESGLHNFGARYFSSSLGRFISSDPSNISIEFRMPQSWNRYAYALNNPLAMVDDNGLWPNSTHGEIIDNAFPGLTSNERNILKASSYNMDYKNKLYGDIDPQDPRASYLHEMSDGNAYDKDPASAMFVARELADRFISDNEAAAADSQRDWIASGHTDLNPASLVLFGNALHPVTDGTSPTHEGFQPWYGPRDPRAVLHVLGEHWITKVQMVAAVAAARQAYRDTYGSMALYHAIDGLTPRVTVRIVPWVDRVQLP